MRFLNLSIVTGISILISFLGLGRDILTARILGVGNDYDCFVAAFSIISLFVVLFNQQNIQSLFMPDYHRIRLKDEKLSSQLKINFGLYLIGITTFISLIIYLTTHPLIQIIFSTFSPDKINLTAQLLRLMLPIIILNATLGVLHSYFHSRDQFLYPAIGQLINAVTIILLLFIGKLDVEQLAYIYLISMGACWIFTIIPIASTTPPVKFSTKSLVNQLAKDGVLILLFSIIEQILQLWYRSCFSNFGTGALSEFSYAWKLIYFPIYLIGFNVSTALLPQITAEISEKKKEQNNIKICSQITLTLLSLAASFLFFFAQDISFLLFNSSAITLESINRISNLLQLFSPYIVITGMNIYLARLAHLSRKSKELLIGTLCIAALQIIFTNFMLTIYGQPAIPLNASISGTMLFYFQIRLIKKNNILAISFQEYAWSTLPPIIATLLIYNVSKPFSSTFINLLIAGIGAFILTAIIAATKRDNIFKRT